MTDDDANLILKRLKARQKRIEETAPNELADPAEFRTDGLYVFPLAPIFEGFYERVNVRLEPLFSNAGCRLLLEIQAWHEPRYQGKTFEIKTHADSLGTFMFDTGKRNFFSGVSLVFPCKEYGGVQLVSYVADDVVSLSIDPFGSTVYLWFDRAKFKSGEMQ